MTISSAHGNERLEIERIAAKYRSDGYDVIVEPGGRKLPSFLRRYQPDLVAIRDGEKVVVEVQRLGSREAGNQTRAMASEIARHSDWRLDIVIMDQPGEDQRLPATRVSSVDALARHLSVATNMYREGNDIAAFLLLWSALEGVAQRRLQLKGRDLEDAANQASMMKMLAFEGLISDAEFVFCRSAQLLRNQVAHGHLSRRIPVRLFERIRVIATRLLNE